MFECVRKKGGKSISQSELWLLESCNWICVFGFPLFLLFPSTTFLQNNPSFPPLNNNTPYTPHEHVGNAVNDNALALFLFTTPSFHTPLPSITLTTPLVLTAHSLCPTTAHGVRNDTMQNTSGLSTHTLPLLLSLHTLIHSHCVALTVLMSIAQSREKCTLLKENTKEHITKHIINSETDCTC